jgi:hypothetical protein
MTETTHPPDADHEGHPGAVVGGVRGAEAPPAGTVQAGTVHADAGHGVVAHGGHEQAEPLGPVDWGAWAAGILGVLAGLVVAACLWLSTSGL